MGQLTDHQQARLEGWVRGEGTMGMAIVLDKEDILRLKPGDNLNVMIAQVLGKTVVEFEEECSQYTQGAYWCCGTDAYFVKCYFAVDTPEVAEAMEAGELEAEERHVLPDYSTDAGAAIPLFFHLVETYGDAFIVADMECYDRPGMVKVGCEGSEGPFDLLPLALCKMVLYKALQYGRLPHQQVTE